MVCVLVKVHEENLTSQRYVVKKRKRILRAFSSNHGYPSLILHQNLIGSNFLKITCNVDSKIITITFHTRYIKIEQSTFPLEWIFYSCVILISLNPEKVSEIRRGPQTLKMIALNES